MSIEVKSYDGLTDEERAEAKRILGSLICGPNNPCGVIVNRDEAGRYIVADDWLLIASKSWAETLKTMTDWGG